MDDILDDNESFSADMGLGIFHAMNNIPDGYEIKISIGYAGNISVCLIDDLGGRHKYGMVSFGECIAVEQITGLTDMAVKFDKAANPINYPQGVEQ